MSVREVLSQLDELAGALAEHPERLHLALTGCARQELHDALVELSVRPLWVHTSGAHVVNAPWVLRELRTGGGVVVLERPQSLDSHERDELLREIDALRSTQRITLLVLDRPLHPAPPR